jgi:hypothetical protein
MVLLSDKVSFFIAVLSAAVITGYTVGKNAFCTTKVSCARFGVKRNTL